MWESSIFLWQLAKKIRDEVQIVILKKFNELRQETAFACRSETSSSIWVKHEFVEMRMRKNVEQENDSKQRNKHEVANKYIQEATITQLPKWCVTGANGNATLTWLAPS